MKITELTDSQLAGITHRAILDGPAGVDPLEWYQGRAEWELEQWAKEAGAAETKVLADKIGKLTDADIADVKDFIESKPVDPEKTDETESLVSEKDV